MHKAKLIPKLAIEGIRKNGSSYFPYILMTTFVVFVFFIFNAISENPMMEKMPHAVHLMMMMLLGSVLLAIILMPILFSTNQFLIKQRKNELGLYNVLGLDQKYIGLMMFIETLILYVMTMTLGIGIAHIFSKLIFLILLNLAGLDVECEFIANGRCYAITLGYFGIVFIINFLGSLWQVYKAKPIELMKSSKKGEKQERGLILKAAIGVLILGMGYFIAINSEVENNIIGDFFKAVLFVVLGTRILFKAGSILILNKAKSVPKLYYQKHRFVTISGMIYRMKRNAQSLSNICIFSTMIMITLICTFSLFIDEDQAIYFNHPLDVVYDMEDEVFTAKEALDEQIKALSKTYQVEVKDQINFYRQEAAVLKNGNAFVENLERNWMDNRSYRLCLMSLDEYNQIEKTNKSLAEDEVLIFSPTKDFEEPTVYLNDRAYTVKEELKSLSIERKQPRNLTSSNYYIVFSSKEQIDEWGKIMHATASGNKLYSVRFNLEGTADNKDAFVSALNNWVLQQEGGEAGEYVGTWEKETRSMFGGLLFIGIFFGIVFVVCLLLMMYYKQITEGYEDQRNFKILKQVGMSDEEVIETIKSQILAVFFLPLVGAILHTIVGLTMVSDLLTTIHLYDTGLIMWCSLGVIIFFAILYVISYIFTSKAYYKIVR